MMFLMSYIMSGYYIALKENFTLFSFAIDE